MPPQIPWDDAVKHVDWSKSDGEIARELGVSRQRIQQVRKANGIPPKAPKTGVTMTVLLRGEPGKLAAIADELTPEERAQALYRSLVRKRQAETSSALGAKKLSLKPRQQR